MTGKRNRYATLLLFGFLAVLIGVPFWLTYRQMQRARASAALIAAIQRHDTSAALAALDAGADPNARAGDKTPSLSQVLRDFWNEMRGHKSMRSKGPTALLLATPHLIEGERVGSEDIRLIRALLAKGADCNVSDEDGDTPLIGASSTGDETIVRLLLEHGANVNARDSNGPTALNNAASLGHTGTVKVLLEYSVNVNARDKDGWTALMGAIRFEHNECAKVLLEHDANVNTRDNSGNSALIGAMFNENAESVKVLLEHGADIHIKDNDGDTAMKLAIETGNGKIATLLKHAGAKRLTHVTPPDY